MGFAGEVRSELATTAEFLQATLNLEKEQGEYLESLHLSNSELRITLIGENGVVLYDNTVTDEEMLENHAKRGEVEAARKNGFGEEKRHSETLGKETYYYAVRLESGNVLRVAKMTSSIYGVFVSVLPQKVLIIVIILLACLAVARRLAKKILAPVKQFGLDQNEKIYDELSPFVKTIKKQKRQIGEAIDEVTRKSMVIDAITGNMKEGMILTDKDGIVLSANKSAMSILEAKISPVGKNILEVTRNRIVLDNMKIALAGEDSNITTEISGRTYHILFNSVDSGVLILFLDITEKAKAEKMRREFTANVSHELRTPLTTISGYTELLSNGMVQAEDVIKVSSKMKSESDRLLTLIEDTMRLAELDEVDDKKKLELFDLTALIEEVVDNLKLKSEKYGIKVQIPAEKYMFTANRSMIFELIYNLVDNAIKYNRAQGSAEITVKQTELESKLETQIQVKDTGIGIEKKHQERIFERFYRVDKSRSKEIGGTGLGLSIVKHIVAYHEGSVQVQSEQEKGTVITVRI